MYENGKPRYKSAKARPWKAAEEESVKKSGGPFVNL